MSGSRAAVRARRHPQRWHRGQRVDLGAQGEIDLLGLVLGELNLIGTAAYCSEHAQVIELLLQGKVPAELFITGRIAVDDIVFGGFTELIENEDENVKILVHP